MASTEEPMQVEEGAELSESMSDSDSEQEDRAEEEAAAAEAAIASNPQDYSAHQQYVAALRKIGNLDKLRAARQAMSALFPLSGDMWQEWAKDEARLLDEGGDISAVEALYERGVNDYLYVPLWLDYLEFVEEHDTQVAQSSPQGLNKMRTLFERAITAGGLHFSEGSKIWEAYQEFEQAVLLAMVDQDEKDRKEQAQRVRSLFHRQLALPLANHASTFEEYAVWEKEQGNTPDEKVMTRYRKAEDACKEYRAYEDNVQAGKPVDTDLLQSYLAYISYEENKVNSTPPRVLILFERAVTIFPVSADLWLKYTSFLDKKLAASSAVCKSVYARALRNCPWVEELWRKYILALERVNASDEEITAVFEQSLQKVFQTPEEYLDVFLTRVDGLRRQAAPADRLREMFKRASEFLATYFPDFVDRSLQLHAYWSSLEIRLSNIEAARAVWETLVKSSGWMTEAWQGYISMELAMGNIKEVRTLYKRCYSRKLEGNGAVVICQAWLRFEREYGSLEDLDSASSKVGQRLEEIRSIQAAQEAKEATKQEHTKLRIEEDKTSKRKRGKDVKEQKKRPKLTPTGDKPVEVSADGPKEETAAQPKQKFYTDERTVFVSNLDLQATEKDLEKLFAPCGGLKEVRLLKDRTTGRSRGFAYVDFETEENLAAAISKNRTRIKDRKISVARSKPKPKEDGERPRSKSVKPLGWVASQGQSSAALPEPSSPKSNDDFRKMLLKKK